MPRRVSMVALALACLPACDTQPDANPPSTEPELTLEKASEPTGRYAFETRTKLAKVAAPETACPKLDPSKLYRFVDGIDGCMVEMSSSEIDEKLNDTFALTILRKDQRPGSVDDIVKGMSAAALEQSSFMVGEGSQIPASAEISRDANRDLRYVVAWTTSSNAPQLFLSAAPGGHSSFLQLIGWDTKNQVFNYYELRQQPGVSGGDKAWSWAGETTMAPQAATHGKGCFDCHHNGVTIMKELERPWNNWQSELAQISPTNVPEAVANEKLFQDREGGDELEKLIKSAYQTYYQFWLRENYQRQTDGSVLLTNTDEMLRRLTTNTTVNFKSSQVQSRGHATSPPNAPLTGMPVEIFLWDDLLRTALGMQYDFPKIEFTRAEFDTYLTEHKFQLEQAQSPTYEVPGSTWFSFFAPVPSAEDQFLILQLKNARVFPDKFVAAVLMVDFSNPTFSAKRAGLQKYGDAIKTGKIEGTTNTLVDDFVKAVQSAAASQPACTGDFLTCSAEQQFMATWNLSDDAWQVESQKRVQSYIDANIKDITLDQAMRLAQARRDSFTTTPIIKNLDEFSLLLPQNDLSQK